MGLVDEFMNEYKYWAETSEERRRRVMRLAFYRQQLHDYHSTSHRAWRSSATSTIIRNFWSSESRIRMDYDLVES